MGTRQSFTPAFKAQMVLELLKEEKSLSELASEHGVHPSQLSRWKAAALEGLPHLFEDGRHEKNKEQHAQEQKVQELYAQIGKLTTQLAWLKKKAGLVDLPE
jgi:transposase